MPILRDLKRLILPHGSAVRRVPFGLFRGLRLSLDFSNQSQYYFGLFEREIAPVMKRAAQSARSYIDVGAGQGEYVLYFLTRPNIERVISFEPEPGEHRRLLQNVGENAVDSARHTARTEMIGDKPPYTRLDDVVTQLAEPIFIKLDVEGAEELVLAGAPNLLSRDASWLVETHSPEFERNSRAILEAAGYSVTVIDRAWWRSFLPGQRDKPGNRWIIAEKNS